MNTSSSKIQLGVRLPEQTVRKIDAARNHKPRAEYCRELIELALAGRQNTGGPAGEEIRDVLESCEVKLSDICQAVIVAERDAAKALAEIRALRSDFATALVGVLTKIGQVVREEDQRQFARQKAEDFVRRVLLSEETATEDQR